MAGAASPVRPQISNTLTLDAVQVLDCDLQACIYKSTTLLMCTHAAIQITAYRCIFLSASNRSLRQSMLPPYMSSTSGLCLVPAIIDMTAASLPLLPRCIWLRCVCPHKRLPLWQSPLFNIQCTGRLFLFLSILLLLLLLLLFLLLILLLLILSFLLLTTTTILLLY